MLIPKIYLTILTVINGDIKVLLYKSQVPNIEVKNQQLTLTVSELCCKMVGGELIEFGGPIVSKYHKPLIFNDFLILPYSIVIPEGESIKLGHGKWVIINGLEGETDGISFKVVKSVLWEAVS